MSVVLTQMPQHGKSISQHDMYQLAVAHLMLRENSFLSRDQQCGSADSTLWPAKGEKKKTGAFHLHGGESAGTAS